jgi:hypothetical protein
VRSRKGAAILGDVRYGRQGLLLSRNQHYAWGAVRGSGVPWARISRAITAVRAVSVIRVPTFGVRVLASSRSEVGVQSHGDLDRCLELYLGCIELPQGRQRQPRRRLPLAMFLGLELCSASFMHSSAYFSALDVFPRCRQRRP